MLLNKEKFRCDRGFVPKAKASDAILTIGLPGRFGKSLANNQIGRKPLQVVSRVFASTTCCVIWEAVYRILKPCQILIPALRKGLPRMALEPMA